MRREGLQALGARRPGRAGVAEALHGHQLPHLVKAALLGVIMWRVVKVVGLQGEMSQGMRGRSAQVGQWVSSAQQPA